jgi:alpha-glucosidase
VPGSTWELYRAALDLRRSHGLGRSTLTWAESSAEVLAFRVSDVLVLTNFGSAPVSLPAGVRVLLSSEPLVDGQVPADVTVWAQV